MLMMMFLVFMTMMWTMCKFHILLVMMLIEMMILMSMFFIFMSLKMQIMIITILLLSVCMGAFSVSALVGMVRFKSNLQTSYF